MANDFNRQASYLPASQHCMVRNQVSVQPYSELKSDLDDEGRFRLKMCTISAAFFIVNLMITAIIAACLLWPSATPKVRTVNDEFTQCRRTNVESPSSMTSSADGKKGPEPVTCSSLSQTAIKQSIVEDCDENQVDELRLQLPKKDCYRTEKDGPLLDKWEVKLNQSSVTVDSQGCITVRYSGIYIVHSSLAFLCNDLREPKTQNTTYWQEIRVNNATYFRDAENITRVDQAAGRHCYRSFLYGLLKLTATDRIQVYAGPPELLRCDETMSFFVLNRP